MEEVTIPPLPEVNQYDRKKMPFDMSPFKGMLPDVVDSIRHNIDGTHFYIIDVPEGNHFCSKYRDGRYFVMNTSRRKGFRGVRRVGKCKGNFICNNNCPFYKQEKVRNQQQFKLIGSNRFCFSCYCLVERVTYNAVKLIEYYFESRLLEVCHHGQHKCQLKPDATEHDEYVKKSLQEIGAKVGPKELAKIQMTKELQKQMETGETDMAAIIEIAAKLTNRESVR